MCSIEVPDLFEETDDRREDPDSEPEPMRARFFLLRPTLEPDALLARELAADPERDLDRDPDLDRDLINTEVNQHSFKQLTASKHLNIIPNRQ